jgi:septal ring-binding cell division protein DamX
MLEGEISQINLIERLVELWREQFTGAIRFENDGIIKIVYFKTGDILSASTNDRSDSIDEILMRAGKVSREHVKQALAKRKESETLGDALLNLGFITRKELTWARRVQVVGVIRSIAAWTEGSFTIVADYLPKRDEGTLFPLPQVLVELIVTEQDRVRFERALDGGNVVFTKTDDFDEVWRRLGLNEDAEAIAVEIDGEKSATAVATASGRDTFNVYKLLHALATLGVLRPAAAAKEFALDDFASAGVADAADVWNSPAPELTDADFAPEPQPAFETADETFEPTVEQPIPAYEPPAAPSAWDEADEVPLDLSLDTTTPSPKMPVWSSTPAPPPISSMPAAEDEPEWGFDEAQIETARAASMPAAASVGAPIPAPKQRSGRYGVLVALMVIAILAAAAYFGFAWWQGRQDAAQTMATATPARPQPASGTPAFPPADAGSVPLPSGAETAPASAAETAALPTATTASVEPPPTQALPRVTARTTPPPAPAGAGRERIDAMAREFAANPAGNFTVQIQILCDAANVEKLVRSGGDSVWFVPQTIGERSCFRVFWGRYNTREQAQQAMGGIPAGVADRNAAVKAVPRG